ncbi:DUF3291 domain-containing protein [Simiduia curdlanivorans]|uniref:DUF3291 domain-containing protein n=1 Tax=Simiduia curdlanivorans TaxID=1492769 RepID=A0ABV8V6M9_9GAMM|nr:DUF3291 domain-containing protein [Simiduia curdlanivorans]MDN3638210.1 DUF3291 domain-containing protein [Simiduia curdlanivorans]
MDRYCLAQINIARARDSMDSETMAGFVERLDEINGLADAAPGFIWRLQTADGDATSIQAFDDPKLIVNMSVWADRDSLRNYVYKSLHVELIRDREAWFEKIAIAHQALWWLPQDHIPTVEEGKARLQHLEDYGPTAHAFTFAKYFEPE